MAKDGEGVDLASLLSRVQAKDEVRRALEEKWEEERGGYERELGPKIGRALFGVLTREDAAEADGKFLLILGGGNPTWESRGDRPYFEGISPGNP